MLNRTTALAAFLVLSACGPAPSVSQPAANLAPIDSAPALYETVADLSDGPYVFGDDGFMPAEKVAVFLEAIERINAAVGFEAVRYEPGNYFAEGMYVNEMPDPNNPKRLATAHRDDASGACYVEMGKEVFMGTVNSPKQTIDLTVAMHESLHCLGIGHDEADKDSMMYPSRLRDREQPITAAMIKIIQEMRGAK